MNEKRKDARGFIDTSASEYAYESKDSDFSCLVKVTCECGWAKAEVVKTGKEEV